MNQWEVLNGTFTTSFHYLNVQSPFNLGKNFNAIDFVYLNCLFIWKIENSGGILIFWGEVANNTNIFSVQFADKNVKRLLLPTQKKQGWDFFRHFSTIEKSYRKEIDLQFEMELLEASEFI